MKNSDVAGHPVIRHFQTMARYNRLANTRLYTACAELDDVERKHDRKAFFGSIHLTLNHILLGDRIWLARFEGNPLQNYRLDDELYEKFDELCQMRQAEDERIQAFADNMTEDFITGSLTWTNNAGLTKTSPHSVLVAHMFNHQTHHRGQIHNMLSQAGIKPPPLDLPWVID